jgi:DNA-binding SARP family transcriptional activator
MLGRGRSTPAETTRRSRSGGVQWWKAFLRRGKTDEQRRSRHDAAKHLGAAGEPATALLEAITAHERLVGDLIAATATERAVLQDLYQSAGLGERTDAFPLAPSAPGGAADRSVEVPADLEARLLGPFEVRYRGQALAPWPSQRAASLLKFLLLHRGRPVRREVLMDAFWPDSSPKSARNNLNVTVYQLRQQLRAHDPGRTHIVYNAGSYRINPELRCRIDVDDYARSVARGHQAADSGDGLAAMKWHLEARRLYAGPLLEDDTSGDWHIETQRRLHFEHCAALERLCALLLERGDVGEAVTVGDELLGTDPCRETGHQLLMRAYAALKQPHLIVQQFRRCEATLRRELSVELSEATVELYRALLADR